MNRKRGRVAVDAIDDLISYKVAPKQFMYDEKDPHYTTEDKKKQLFDDISTDIQKLFNICMPGKFFILNLVI